MIWADCPTSGGLGTLRLVRQFPPGPVGSLREPDPWQLGNVKEFPALERACGCAAPICQHTRRETHSRPLLTAQIINTVAGRMPPSAERSVHPRVLVSQGISAKCPPQTPTGVMWSEPPYTLEAEVLRSFGTPAPALGCHVGLMAQSCHGRSRTAGILTTPARLQSIHGARADPLPTVRADRGLITRPWTEGSGVCQ